MGAVPIMIMGTITGKSTKEGDVSATEQVVIHGFASIEGLGVGGGPIQTPPGIWPSPGHPAFPIVMPPGSGSPGGPYPPSAEHPIVIPRPPDPFPQPPPDSVAKPPPPGGGWGWHPDYGWGYFPGSGLTPGPKA